MQVSAHIMGVNGWQTVFDVSVNNSCNSHQIMSLATPGSWVRMHELKTCKLLWINASVKYINVISDMCSRIQEDEVCNSIQQRRQILVSDDLQVC